MAAAIIDAGIAPESDRQSLIDVLETYWEDKIAVTWTIEDVFTLADEQGIQISEEEAMDVLQQTLDDHDAQYGVNWDTLRSNLPNQ